MNDCGERNSADCVDWIAITLEVPVPKWRNWQTRYIQGVVPSGEWRFESSLRHQIVKKILVEYGKSKSRNDLRDFLVLASFSAVSPGDFRRHPRNLKP